MSALEIGLDYTGIDWIAMAMVAAPRSSELSAEVEDRCLGIRISAPRTSKRSSALPSTVHRRTRRLRDRRSVRRVSAERPSDRHAGLIDMPRATPILTTPPSAYWQAEDSNDW
jgi:hypothetical protein